MVLAITSPAFLSSGPLSSRYTCEGTDVSPPLVFSGVPHATESLVLIVEDPDAPDPAAPKMTYVHWLLYNLPPTTMGLPEAVVQLPEGTREGRTDFGATGYGGPCPPIGTHRYYFKLYALDTVLDFKSPPIKAELVSAMTGHILEEAVLIGTYKLSHHK